MTDNPKPEPPPTKPAEAPVPEEKPAKEVGPGSVPPAPFEQIKRQPEP
jgi:hypothetical protein